MKRPSPAMIIAAAFLLLAAAAACLALFADVPEGVPTLVVMIGAQALLGAAALLAWWADRRRAAAFPLKLFLLHIPQFSMGYYAPNKRRLDAEKLVRGMAIVCCGHCCFAPPDQLRQLEWHDGRGSLAAHYTNELAALGLAAPANARTTPARLAEMLNFVLLTKGFALPSLTEDQLTVNGPSIYDAINTAGSLLRSQSACLASLFRTNSPLCLTIVTPEEAAVLHALEKENP